MAKITIKQKSLTINRNGETFDFVNDENLDPLEFALQCEEIVDEQVSARAAARKYAALGNALLQQKTTGATSTDYEARVLELKQYEKSNPKLSKNFVKQLTDFDKGK